MKCPKCMFENPEGSKFCLECGGKIEIKCPHCNQVLPAEAKFCNECGRDIMKRTEPSLIDYSQPQSYTPKHLADKILTTRSAIEGERKIVTVLFADVANSMAIFESLDPEEVHEIMDGCFRILLDEIHRYEGTINQFRGDGVMAIFGAPVAHEDHPQRACYAALGIQKTFKDYSEELEEKIGINFQIRIGLNSGHVVVGSIGDDLRMDYTADGDTTNLASRMESMATPGTILISKNTYKMAKDFFEFDQLGKTVVKGKEEAQDVYKLMKASKVKTRIEAAVAKGLTKFVGRLKEIEDLKGAFEKARSGDGHIVGIVGEAGVGKSRLLLELINMLPEGQYTYYEGRCLHYGASMAYLPILDILRAYFDIKEGNHESGIKKKLEEKILRLDKRLIGLLSPFQELLSLNVEDEKYLHLDPGQKKMRTLEAIRNLFVRESENKPLVLAVEDLHWIDKISEELLDYLIEWLPNAHILLILLYRPEYTHKWGSKSYYSKIGADQLTAETSAELVQAILEGGEVEPQLKELILSRAGGNPLFVEELTRSLMENGSIQKRNREYVLTRRASEIQVPDTIQGVITARIDRVEESLKRIMRVASVIGREFAFRILQAVVGMQEELKSSLLNLQGQEFISEKRLFPELEYIFKHALTQEVAYNSLLLKRRKEIHEKIGSAIEELYPERLEEYYELLAHHYAHSENRDKALRFIVLANRKAANVHAMEEAKVYFDEAMELLNTLPDINENQERRISLLVNQSIVFQLIFKFPEYYELLTRYEPMAVELDNQKLLGAFYNRKGHCEWWFGKFDQALQTRTKALELCEAVGSAEDAGHSYQGMAFNYLFKGDFDQVFIVRDNAIRIMEKGFNLRWYVWALSAASFAYSHMGRWDESVKEALKALNVAEEYSDNSMICFADFIISIAYTFKGDLDRGKEYGELAVQKAPTPADKVWAQTMLAWTWCRAGEPNRGIEVLSRTVQIYRSTNFWALVILSTPMLGEGYWLAGKEDKARQTIEELVEIADQCKARYHLGWAHRLLGEIELETNPTQAASHFKKGISILQEIKAENELALANAGYGRLHKIQGDIYQARKYLTKALKVFERLGTLVEPDRVKKELTRLSGA